MDRPQFDRLSRLVASAGTRRNVLRLLMASATAGIANRDNAAARKRHHTRDRGPARARAGQALQCTTICLDCSTKKPIPGANLTRCDFDEQDLAGVNLGGANLTRACFARADLHNARFRGANVSGTCFCGADLTGADFRGSKVTSEQLACATVDCTTILPDGTSAAPCAKGERCCDGVCRAGDCGPRTCSGGPPVETGCNANPPSCTCPSGTTCEEGLCCIASGQPEGSVPGFFCCSSTSLAGICCSDPFLGKCTSDAGCCSGTCDLTDPENGFCR
jgi:hypothetical protein